MPDVIHQHDSACRSRTIKRWIIGLLIVLTMIAIMVIRSAIDSGTSLEQIARAMREGPGDPSIEQLLGFVQRHPDNIRAWELLGQCYEANRNFDAAADAWSHSAAANPESVQIRLKYAELLLKAARLDQAEGEYREILKAWPDTSVARTELQWILFNQMRERELEAFLESHLDPENVDYSVLFHLIYSSQRPPNPRESVGKMEAIEKQQPGQAGIQLALARCYWKLGDPQRARRYFEQSRPAPDVDGHHTLAFAEFLLESGEPEQAMTLLNPAAKPHAVWPQDDRWWWLLSQCQMQNGDLSAALESVNMACQLRAGNSTYVFQKATLLRAYGKQAEATQQLELLESLRAAESELYLLVSRGDLNRPSKRMCMEVSRLCELRCRLLQARCWQCLADQQSNVDGN